MPEKYCVFVDGENFRFSLVELFKGEFRKEEYLPKKANWFNLFSEIGLRLSIPDQELLRTYWYVVNELDLYPYNLPDPEKETDKTKKLLSKKDEFRKELISLSGGGLISRMKEIIVELVSEEAKIKKRFEGWKKVQDSIATNHNSIEFRRAGAIRYSLFKKQFENEKAVDVKLASDLITLRDIYDTAVVFSGDQDFVPAVSVIKDSGKRVANVYFTRRDGKTLPHGSWRLNKETDFSIALTYDDLKKHLF